MLSKAQLRAHLKQRRLAMPEPDVAAKSALIVARLRYLIDQSEFVTIHCFEPLAALHEVDVLPLLTYLKLERPQTTIYTSRFIGDSWQIVKLDGQVTTGHVDFDCVIVPMLGFDRRLHRLGYGAGYYDRLLNDQTGARKIGVCFELGKVREFPNEPHDVPLDSIVTEEQIYRNN